MNPKLLRPLAAETIGTLLFVFLGAGSIVMTAATGGTPGPLGIALAHGVGLAIFVDALVGGNLTGAMMNPARALGPAIVAHDMHAQAVYWIGPLVGAAAAGWVWRAALRGPSS